MCERAGVYDVVKVLDFGLVKELGTEVGVTCRNASLASATVVTIPRPAFAW